MQEEWDVNVCPPDLWAFLRQISIVEHKVKLVQILKGYLFSVEIWKHVSYYGLVANSIPPQHLHHFLSFGGHFPNYLFAFFVDFKNFCRFVDFCGFADFLCICSFLADFQLNTDSYCTFGFKLLVGHWKNIDDILMRSKTPFLAEMKRTCAWKFVRSSYIIGRDNISDKNYWEETVSIVKMASFSL